MNTVSPINRTELNQSKQHYKSLTEEQKLRNMIEGNGKVFRFILEEAIKRGDLQNANN